MCDPVSMLVISAGVTTAGGLYSANQTNAAGKAEQTMYDTMASNKKTEGDYAVKVGEQRETLAENQGAIDSKIASRNSAQMGATQRAIEAANGVAAGVTAGDIAGDTMDKRTLDQMAIKYGADSKAWEAKTQAGYQKWSDYTEADQYTAAGVNARRAAANRANATLLGTAGQVAGSAFQYSMYANSQ